MTNILYLLYIGLQFLILGKFQEHHTYLLTVGRVKNKLRAWLELRGQWLQCEQRFFLHTAFRKQPQPQYMKQDEAGKNLASFMTS